MTTIARIESHVLHVSPKTNWWFLSVTDSSGAEGWGEGSLNGWEPMLDTVCQQWQTDWLGLDLEHVQQQVRAAPASPGGLVGNTVVSAFLQAVLALQAQHAACAPHTLLGPVQRQAVPLYANINRATRLRTPQGFVETALRARAQGFSRFKAAPFDGLTPALCASAQGQALIAHGVECMLALRQALGPDAMLMVDCHWRFDETRALQALQALAPADLHWFECPIAETHAHWPAMRRLRAATREQGVLLAAAETQVGLASFQTLFEEALYDVVMPDIKYCGGPLEMLKIAQRAAEHGVLFSPHNPSGPVCTWHSLQIAALAPECAMLELQFEESPLYEQLLDGPAMSTQGGGLSLERAYGESLALNTQLLQAHPFQPVPPGIETQLNR
jgi:galactonate dehydratase